MHYLEEPLGVVCLGGACGGVVAVATECGEGEAVEATDLVEEERRGVVCRCVGGCEEGVFAK